MILRSFHGSGEKGSEEKENIEKKIMQINNIVYLFSAINST